MAPDDDVLEETTEEEISAEPVEPEPISPEEAPEPQTEDEKPTKVGYDDIFG